MPSWDIAELAARRRQRPSQVGAMEKIIDLAEVPRWR